MNKCVICGKDVYSSTPLVNLDETHQTHLDCFFSKVPSKLEGDKRKEHIEKLRVGLIEEHDSKHLREVE